jgi:hypothetical protein
MMCSYAHIKSRPSILYLMRCMWRGRGIYKIDLLRFEGLNIRSHAIVRSKINNRDMEVRKHNLSEKNKIPSILHLLRCEPKRVTLRRDHPSRDRRSARLRRTAATWPFVAISESDSSRRRLPPPCLASAVRPLRPCSSHHRPPPICRCPPTPSKLVDVVPLRQSKILT